MPRPSKGPRLYLRRRSGRAGVWVIRDGASEVSTRFERRSDADLALARYIQSRHRPPAEEVTLDDVLAVYAEEHATTVADPARIGYALKALAPFWAHLSPADVIAANCRRYAAERGVAPSTARRELGTLAAALHYAEKTGLIPRAPAVTLPSKPSPRDRWLTRDEAARLLWAAWRNPDARHLSRFILIGLYTGARRDAVLGLRLDGPHDRGGWIDIDGGRLHRRGAGERATKKRRDVARCPDRLLAHARRWRALGARWAVERDGQRVGSIKTAWPTARDRAGLDAAVTPHCLRRTAATWLMQAGVDPWEAGGFLSMSRETLEGVYAQHHPDFQSRAAEAISGARPRNALPRKLLTP